MSQTVEPNHLFVPLRSTFVEDVNYSRLTEQIKCIDVKLNHDRSFRILFGYRGRIIGSLEEEVVKWEVANGQMLDLRLILS
jgi:hypothetical protein